MNEVVAPKRIRFRVPVTWTGGPVKIRPDKSLAPGEEDASFEHELPDLPQLLERGTLELVDEPEVPELALRPAVELRAEHLELKERVAKSGEELAIAKAAVTDAENTLRPLVVRMRRGDKDATKDRDAAERRLESAQRAERDAQYANDADVAELQPRIDELSEAIAFAEEREKRQRDEAEAAVRWSRYLASLARVAHSIDEVQSAIEEHVTAAHAVGSHVVAFQRLLDPVGIEIFYGYPHTKVALDGEARTADSPKAELEE
jgi:chromosome segregation ATPase